MLSETKFVILKKFTFLPRPICHNLIDAIRNCAFVVFPENMCKDNSDVNMCLFLLLFFLRLFGDVKILYE